MNSKKSIGIFALFSIVLIVGCFLFGLLMPQVPYNDPFAQDELEPQFLEAQSTNNRTTHKTAYVLETYDLDKQLLTEEHLPIIAEYIGVTQAELIDVLEQQSREISLEEEIEGLKRYALVSFHPEQIVIRKTYNTAAAGISYYLLSENGYVTVYYQDRKSVFEYTDIQTVHLPIDVQVEVISGKEIAHEEALYNFLETYSS